MILVGADVIIKIKCTISLICLSHPKTIPSHLTLLKNCLPWKLVPGAKNIEDCCFRIHKTLRFFSPLTLALLPSLSPSPTMFPTQLKFVEEQKQQSECHLTSSEGFGQLRYVAFLKIYWVTTENILHVVLIYSVNITTSSSRYFLQSSDECEVLT